MFDNFEIRDFLDVDRFVQTFESSHEEEPVALQDALPDEQSIADAAIAGA